jgi:hypothetical protein
MVKRSSNGKAESELFRLYEVLDQYEELLEEMAELGVESREDAERRIVEINQQIDRLEAEDGEPPA